MGCAACRSLRTVVRIETWLDSALTAGVATYVPVDPGTRVPARVRLLGVVHPHRDHVALLPIANMRRQLVAERAIAIRPLAEVLAVDPDLAVAIHAIELDEHDLTGVAGGKCERLPIPGDAAGECATGHARGVLLAERSLDAPVVGQIQPAPGGVGEPRLLRARHVAEMKAPPTIETLGFALRQQHQEEREHCLSLGSRGRRRGSEPAPRRTRSPRGRSNWRGTGHDLPSSRSRRSAPPLVPASAAPSHNSPRP